MLIESVVRTYAPPRARNSPDSVTINAGNLEVVNDDTHRHPEQRPNRQNHRKDDQGMITLALNHQRTEDTRKADHRADRQVNAFGGDHQGHPNRQ